MDSVLRKPSAWLPIVMSATALLLVIGYAAVFGIQKSQRDEGAAARIFQLLLAGQIPIMAYFVFKWLPKKPKQSAKIIVLQMMGILLAFGLIFFLEL